MQTIERPTQTHLGEKGRPPWLPLLAALVSVACVAVLIFAIFNKWAVLILTILAALVGLGIWTWKRGFRAIEIIAFLIHFDGIAFKAISVGRIGAAVLTVLIIRKLVVDRWRPPAVQWKNWFPIWLLLSWSTITGIWSLRSGGWLKSFLMLYLAIVFFCITSMLVESHKDIQRFLRAFWVGGLFGSAAGILALFLGTRSEGLIGDPNFFGLLEASMIPLTVYYRRQATDALVRAFYTLTLLMVLGGAAGAGSRSGLIGASLVIVVTMLTKPGLSIAQRARTGAIAVLVAPIAFGVGFIVNPSNLERGFSDRGAGRLDFWGATTEMIAERPVVGQGFGQTQYKLPQRLLVTPGVMSPNEKRETVSSHNVWLDVLSDTGVIGLSIFVLCFIMALWSLLRPRWPYMSDLSTTILAMFVPVFSASLFLPLLNNKLAWSIIGLAAALQIPSNASRWKGLSGESSGSPGDGTSLDLVPYGEPAPPANLPVRPQSVLANPVRIDTMPEVDLARWDLRITRSMRRTTAAVVVIAAVGTYLFGSALPSKYEATAGFIAPELGVPYQPETFRLPTERTQKALILVTSEAYAKHLKELSGIDRSVPEITEHISVEKPKMAGLVNIHFQDPDRKVVEQAAPYLIAAVNEIYSSAREFGAGGVNEEARPMNPGEQNYYSGTQLIPAFSEPVVDGSEPKKLWMALMGGLAAGIITMGLYMSGCRKPRVTTSDDFVAHTGTKVWMHVDGERARRQKPTPTQLQQLAVTLDEAMPTDRHLRRVVVSPAERSSDARTLTIGLASALVARGERVVLVDADVERPWMSLSLDPVLGQKRPGADDPLDLKPVRVRRLSSRARRLVGERSDDLRLLRGSQLLSGERNAIDVGRLAEFDENVTVVVLAPSTDSSVGAKDLFEWAQVSIVPMRTGVTTTDAAQAATARVRLLGNSPNGIVLINS